MCKVCDVRTCEKLANKRDLETVPTLRHSSQYAKSVFLGNAQRFIAMHLTLYIRDVQRMLCDTQPQSSH
jgi:hypothetical protein